MPNYNYYKNKAKEKSAIIYGQQINSAIMYNYGKNNGAYNIDSLKDDINNYTCVDIVDIHKIESEGFNIEVSFKVNGCQYKLKKRSMKNFLLVNDKDVKVYEE